MHKIVNILAVALSVLPNLPSATVAAEPALVSARGAWTDVTPNGVDLVNTLSCDNYGSITMVADPARPSDLFTQFHCHRTDQYREWRRRGERSGRTRHCTRSGWIASDPLFGRHSRHRGWFLEIHGRRRELDQLSRGARRRSARLLSARRQSPSSKSFADGQASAKLDCPELRRRRALV